MLLGLLKVTRKEDTSISRLWFISLYLFFRKMSSSTIILSLRQTALICWQLVAWQRCKHCDSPISFWCTESQSENTKRACNYPWDCHVVWYTTPTNDCLRWFWNGNNLTGDWNMHSLRNKYCKRSERHFAGQLTLVEVKANVIISEVKPEFKLLKWRFVLDLNEAIILKDWNRIKWQSLMCFVFMLP